MLPLFEEYTGKMWPDKIYLSCFAELNAAENVWKLKEAAHIHRKNSRFPILGLKREIIGFLMG